MILIMKPKLKDMYEIRRVETRVAIDFSIKNHYLHRQSPCTMSFGLFEDNEMIGIVMYGVSISSTLLKGICGADEMNNVYELVRLWIKDGTPKNTESYLIGNTLKLLDREIVVSFADSGYGHVGTVYQATNFLYCGLSSKHKDIRIRGREGGHNQTITRGMKVSEIRDKFGAENIYYVERSRKHKYIYFNAGKKRRRQLFEKLKYKVLPYPKKNKQLI